MFDMWKLHCSVISRDEYGLVVLQQCEKQRHIDDLIRNGVEEGLKVSLDHSLSVTSNLSWFKHLLFPVR